MPDEIKKFKHSLVFSKSDISDVGDAIWTPTIRDWRDVIEDYVDISKKRRHNKFAMFKLQINLISEIVLLNDTIKGYKELIENPEIRKAKFPDIEDFGESINYWESELKSHKIILSALKDIGDGIAWRLLEYNRSIIYNMCVNNQESGPLVLNQGLISELHAIGDYTNNKDVENIVYHGITNFLLIGDLTIKYKNGDINFIEMKSQKNQRGSSWKERVARQIARADNLITIANEGEGISTGVAIKTHFIEGAPIVGIKKIRSLLNLAKNSNAVSISLSQFLTIFLVNFSNVEDDENVKIKMDLVYKNLKKATSDKIIPLNSIDSLIFSPNRAPLSIHEFSSEDIANILLGRYVIWYLFNVSAFIREIEKHDWKVSNDIYSREDTESDKSIFTVSRNNLNLKIPPSIISRVIHEGLSINSLIKLFDDHLKAGLIGEGYGIMPEYKKEYELWD